MIVVLRSQDLEFGFLYFGKHLKRVIVVRSFIHGGDRRSTTFVSGLCAYDDVFVEQ